MKIKYVILHDVSAILLSNNMQHSDFSKYNVTSAGFCAFEKTYALDENEHEVGDWEVCVFGKSVSLGIESKGEDVRIIRNLLNNK